MMNKRYVSRTLESLIRQAMNQFPVVLLTGPRQTGKSTLLSHLFPEYRQVSLDDPLVRGMAMDDPDTFLLNHPPPVVIDEIQYAPQLLTHIKIRVDRHRDQNGQFVLTGSQAFPLMQGASESLAGRVALFELLGLSVQELVDGGEVLPDNSYEWIFRGSFPDVAIHGVDPFRFNASYISTYLERDLRQMRAVSDLHRFQFFLQLTAARAGNLTNWQEIAKEAGMSGTTVRDWLGLLETSRLVYRLKPYSRNLTKRVVKHPKLYFCDCGLLSHLLRYPGAGILEQGPMSGAFFENFVVMEVLKYQINHGGAFELYFYRDSNHNEVDLVIDFGYRLILVEIKKNRTLRPEQVKGLKKIGAELSAFRLFLVTNHPQKMMLDPEVTHLPWWEIGEIFV